MTSDAKIGLLLGLVFIFIIAFIINGLPRFRSNTNNNELTTNMVNSQNERIGIAARERKAQEAFNRTEQDEKEPDDEIQPSSEDREKVRFEMKWPKDILVVKDKSVSETADSEAGANVPASSADEKTKVVRPKPGKPAIYVVTEGDNLAVVAQKFYGPEAGNKIVNVMRIFEANRKLLKSPDEVYAGQKLTIPPLPGSTGDKEKTGGIFSKGLFERIKAIGGKRSSANPPAKPRAEKRNKQYVVREDDTLWRIASEQLGDGTRYKEISELNADVLEDEDYIIVGMRLKMPAQ